MQKALSLLLTPLLAPTLSRHCYHLAGRGGCKAAVQHIEHHAGHYEFVVKSDVHSYYASMDHAVLQGQLAERIADRGILRLLASFLTHVTDWRGFIEINRQGIVQGSPLSPLLGALYLAPLDDALEQAVKQCRGQYARFMDDWIALAPTRHSLRRIVRIMNRVLADLKVSKHPMKTYIGRCRKGFDFLGFRLGLPPDPLMAGSGASLPIALSTLRKHLQKCARLYEQGTSPARIGKFCRGWVRWVCASTGKMGNLAGPPFENSFSLTKRSSATSSSSFMGTRVRIG